MCNRGSNVKSANGSCAYRLIERCNLRVSLNLSADQGFSYRERICDNLPPNPIRGLACRRRYNCHKVPRPIQDDNCNLEIRTKSHSLNGDKPRPSRHDNSERLDATRLIDECAIFDLCFVEIRVSHDKRTRPDFEAGAIGHRRQNVDGLGGREVSPRRNDLLPRRLCGLCRLRASPEQQLPGRPRVGPRRGRAIGLVDLSRRPTAVRNRRSRRSSIEHIASRPGHNDPPGVKAWICWKLGAGLTGPAA